MDSDEKPNNQNVKSDYNFTGLPIKKYLTKLSSKYLTHTDRDADVEEEFIDHKTDLMQSIANALLPGFAFFVLVTWPFDSLVFQKQEMLNSLFTFRCFTMVMIVWLFTCINISVYFKNHIISLLFFSLLGYFGIVGLIYGQIDIKQSEFLFHSSWMIPYFTIPLLLYLFQRLFYNLFLTASFILGYVWVRPRYLNDPYFWFQILDVLGLILFSFLVGHIFFHLYRTYYYEVLREKKDREHLRDAFSRFITTSVMEDVIENPDDMDFDGENREITVLFTDINDFTNYSEGKNAQEVASTLNEILTKMTDSVLNYDGVVDKYLGDGMVSEFGILPMEPEDHSERACKAALDILNRLEDLKANWEDPRKKQLDFRVGIHTGIAATGNMGTEMRFDYTAIGDTVNVGSRLEGANKIYGTRCIMSRMTYRKCSDEFVARELDKIKVPGKEESIVIYELLGSTDTEASRHKQLIDQFEEGLRLYRNLNWDDASKVFKTLLDKYPNDGPTQEFLRRINDLKDETMRSDWDGSYDLGAIDGIKLKASEN